MIRCNPGSLKKASTVLIWEPFIVAFFTTILSKRRSRVKAERNTLILTLTCVPFKLNFQLYCIIRLFY